MKENKYLSKAEIRLVDTFAVNELGVPSIVLMENAGIGVVQAMLKRFPQAEKSIILCGKGNNGGDGLVVARQLFILNRQVTVVLVDDHQNLSQDAQVNFAICKNLGMSVTYYKDIKLNVLDNYDIVVDAVYGSGFAGNLPDKVRSLFSYVNSMPANFKRVAVDIPSGMDGDTGCFDKDTFKADLTVTMHALKKGFASNGAAHVTGEIEVVHIGIPSTVLQTQENL